jgi:hypothetical protein
MPRGDLNTLHFDRWCPVVILMLPATGLPAHTALALPIEEIYGVTSFLHPFSPPPLLNISA